MPDPESDVVKARLIVRLDALRTSFWFVPAVMMLAAGILFVATREIDAWLGNGSHGGALTWTYTGDAEGARGLLSTIAGSVITVGGVSFSITIAALTLASSQFGPRLLRTFLRDRGNQIVLGILVATFLYSLLVLRTVRGEDAGSVVPQLSITVSVVLAIASVAVWIYFIHHVATAMQANHVIAAVGDELDRGIDNLFPEALGHGREEAACALPRVQSAVVRASRTGYLQAIDEQALLSLLRDHDALLRLQVRPGDFLIEAAEIGIVWPADRAGPAFDAAVADAMSIGIERTPVQDIDFSIDQLVEIAQRALSPGVNDPFTAIACVDRLGAAIHRLADRAMPRSERAGDDGAVRVIACPVTFDGLVARAIDPLRDAARSQALVTLRLLDVLEPSLSRVGVGRRAPLLEQLEAILQGSQALPDAGARERVRERYRELVEGASRAVSRLRGAQ